jgi:nicotinate-nucleotide adenylyltransferase
VNIQVLMGGTFDPIHYGHLRIADGLRTALGLDELALLPTATPPHKPLARMTPAAHRVEMVRLSLSEFPALTVCPLELTDSTAFTIDTLRKLRNDPPVVDPVFVVGMDSVGELSTWHKYRELLEEFDLISIERPGYDGEAAKGYDPFVAERVQPMVTSDQAQRLIDREQLGRGGRIFPLSLPAEAISSRGIRRRSASGEALDDLVPVDVALYIQRHDLYARGVQP